VNEVDCVVIGAGVIGLAIARALACEGREVIILERERHFGMHTSSRNSEVIHAGIHYQPNSLKARTCVSGRDLLYRYCAERGIAHRRCGKLTVATSEEQLTQLHAIESQARSNGVFDLEWLDGAQARRSEPKLRCSAALWSPSTGIIDSHGYMLSLLADAEAHGGQIAYGAAVSSLRPAQSGIDIFIDGAPVPAVRAQIVVNSAGLDAHRVAQSIEGFPAKHIPAVRYAKGSYFALSGSAPFARLIYPVPESGGLGIHMTLDLAGQARFGPDVEWVDSVDYVVDAARAVTFYDAIRRYWPGLGDGQLSSAYAGVRPKLAGIAAGVGAGAAATAADFCISGPADHGVAGVVNLFGMESPGLTASPALAAHVASIVGAWN
jgi:L-2-hydroxyglutarate oxidase LhgO